MRMRCEVEVMKC